VYNWLQYFNSDALELELSSCGFDVVIDGLELRHGASRRGGREAGTCSA
jgi:hypothetical protein